MARIGTAWIEVDADLDKFQRRVARELGQFEDKFKGIGNNAGANFSRSFNRGTASTTGTLKNIEAQADSAGNAMVAAGRRGAGAMDDVDRKSRRATKGVAGLVGAFGDGGGGIHNAARALDAFGGASGGATATIGGFRIAMAAIIPTVIGFGGAAVSAGAALAPLIGLAAGGAGIFASLGQGMGVFALATGGIGDALKEHTNNQLQSAGAAVSNAGQQRSAARAIQSAQDGLRNATRALADAQEDQRKATAALAPALTAARMAFTDLREAVADAGLSLRGAKIATDEARQALADLLAGPSPRELADAHRAITDALRGEADAAVGLDDAHQRLSAALRGEESAVQNLAEAHRALNALLAPPDVLSVADATDRVTDAVRGEERARLNLNDQIKATAQILAAPGSTEDQKARARLDLADAENAVGDASRATEHAKRDLAKLEAPADQDAVAAARRRVSDAELAVADAARGTTDARRGIVDAEYAVGEAARGVIDARAALAELEKPASARDLAKARLDVAEAENALGDAQHDRLRAARELATAEGLGISGAPEVVAARDALAEADRAVADAERDVARATQAVSDAQLSAKESAAGAAISAAGLTDKMDKLSPAAQEFARHLIALKPKLDDLKATAAEGFFPGATAGLDAAMGSFDNVKVVVAATAKVLGEFMRKLGELVGSAAFGKDIETIGTRNAKVLDTLGEAVRHIISAFRHVLVAAGPLTQWLADVANGWALNAAEGAKAGRESGKMAEFFERTRAIAERLGSILKNLAGGLMGVGKAGTESGNEIWASIDRASKRFNEWANSAKGQSALKDFFERTKELAAQLVPVFAGITKGLGLMALKILPLTTVLAILGPLADEATIAFVAYKIAQMAAAIVTNIATAAMWLFNQAMTANPIMLVVVGLAALAAGLYLAYKKSETFREIVDAAFAAVKAVVEAVVPVVVSIVTTAFDFIKAYFVTVFTIYKAIFTTAFAVLKAIVTTVWHAIMAVTGVVWDAIKLYLTTVFGIYKTIFTTVFGALKTIVTGAWEGIKTATTAAWGFIRDHILGPIRAARDAIGDVVSGIGNRLSSAWETIKSAASKAWDFVKEHILGPIRGARDAIGAVLEGIGNRASDAWEAIKKGVGKFAGAVEDAIVGAFERAVRGVKKFINLIIGAINAIPGVPNIDKLELAEGGKVAGKARGGTVHMDAFEKGGHVTRPLVVVGEEAPRHPEYVIPTNPAYRSRALGLHAALSRKLGIPGFFGGGILDKAGDIATGAFDTIKGAISSLIGALPGVGDLPDWLKDTGKWVLEKVGKWIKDKATSLIDVVTGGNEPTSGGTAPRGGTGRLAQMIAAKFKVPITDGWRPANVGYGAPNSSHKKGTPANPGAHDFGTTSPAAKAYAYKLGAKWADIHRYVNGQTVYDGGPGTHLHVSWYKKGGIVPPFIGSYASGGVVPQDGLGYLHRGELVSPADSATAGLTIHIDEVHNHGGSFDEERLAQQLFWRMETAAP